MREIQQQDKQFLVYVEFIEVISRIATEIFKKEQLDTKQAIEMVLEAIRNFAIPSTYISTNRK